MKTKILHTFLILIPAGILVLVSSCTIYEPQMVSIPLISVKNEVQLDAGVSALGGVYGSVAFAPAQHVALQVYGAVYPENTNFQGAIGYATKTKSDLNFEIYGGFGTGKGTKYTDDNSTTYSNADYSIYFVQANIGQTNQGSAHLDYGFGFKAGTFYASIKDNLYTTIEPYNTNGILIEPQAFVRLGGERFKVGFQMNGTKIFSGTVKDPLFNEFYLPFNFGLSLNYHFAPSIKKK